MDYDGGPRTSGRDTYMAIILCLMVGLPVFVFLNILTGGLFILVLASLAVLAVLGAVHYLLWGRGFSRETAGEREEEDLIARMEAEDWPDDDPRERRH